MRAFITKYALTQGILEVEGELDRDGEYLIWKNAGSWMKQYTPKRDFSLSLQDALAVAELARVKKLGSVKKQLSKLETLEVKVRHL